VEYNKLIEPKNYDEAWIHPDKFKKEKLREAISKEFQDMERQKVWQKINQSEIPNGQQYVKHKWVVKSDELME
jgi:hypothetical protein